MEKEQEDKPINEIESSKKDKNTEKVKDKNQEDQTIKTEKEEEEQTILTSEQRIEELEDKLSRAFAEMENQRRRFEKEKDEAFDYGGLVFAKEALSLIDNLERSKQILEN